MESQVLKKVAKLLQSSDWEMRSLGEEIFIQSNPTTKDVSDLNKEMGYPDILFHYDETQANQVIEEKDQLVDILFDREAVYHGYNEAYDRRKHLAENSTPGGLKGSGDEKSGFKYTSRFGLRGG